MEDSRHRKHVEVDSVEKGYDGSFSLGPEFNRAAEFARKAAEESASASAFSKDAYKRSVFLPKLYLCRPRFAEVHGNKAMYVCRAEEASYYRKEAEDAELRLTEAQAKLRQGICIDCG